MADGCDNAWLGKRLSRREALDTNAINALNTLTITKREFDPGQYILREGDRPKFCSYLQRGFVYCHKIVGDGGRQIVSLHVPGDFVDVQNILLDQSDHNIQALTEAVILMIPIEDLIGTTISRR